MKKISFILFSVLLTACAGNPPDWWNPSGTYGKAKQTDTQAQQVNTVPSGSSKVAAEDETPAEQTIDAVWDDNYEEMNLDPIDEKAEAERAATQATQQSVANTSGQVQVPVQSAATTNTGSLPPPSVLE